MNDPTDIVWHSGIDASRRRRLLGRCGATLWFTGLSGSGKSTIAAAVERSLLEQGIAAYRLDGDNIRHGLNRDLGFEPKDRAENIRRICEVARLFTDATLVTLVSFISPYRADRDAARHLHEEAKLPFAEIHIDCPLAEAEKRDPKGLYRKARAGQITGFTGIDAPYEPPLKPELKINTAEVSVAEAVEAVEAMLSEHRWLEVS